MDTHSNSHCRGLGVTVCCLGPITTGTPGQPRYVYGASSLEPTTDSTKGRLTVDAAAAWVAAAAHHGVDRTWISKQPVLSLGETKASPSTAYLQCIDHLNSKAPWAELTVRCQLLQDTSCKSSLPWV